MKGIGEGEKKIKTRGVFHCCRKICSRKKCYSRSEQFSGERHCLQEHMEGVLVLPGPVGSRLQKHQLQFQFKNLLRVIFQPKQMG